MQLSHTWSFVYGSPYSTYARGYPANSWSYMTIVVLPMAMGIVVVLPIDGMASIIII